MTIHEALPTAVPQCGACPIRHRAVCARCEADELAALDALKFYRSFEAGQTLLWAGDRMEFVASVVSGVATLTQVMEDGRTQTVGLLFPSDFVGRPGRERAPYNVIATTDLLMCCFRKKPFEELMARTPAIGQRLLEMTLDELDAAHEWMLLLGRKTARERLASFLTRLSERQVQLGGAVGHVHLPMTRLDIADYLGLTIETVSRVFTQFKTSGLIQLLPNNEVALPDPEALKALGEGAA